MTSLSLRELAVRAWCLHEGAVKATWLVKPSAPVLYFGDSDAYGRSDVRIATVALNPSRVEFPAGAPFSRFPGAEIPTQEPYLKSLNAYFDVSPYKNWFDFFDQALRGMQASYWKNNLNVALHTDIASILATDPTWSKLHKEEKERLASAGIPLWHALMATLEPDILLWSTAKEWLEQIGFPAVGGWFDICAFEEKKDGKRRRPVIVKGRWFRIIEGKLTLVAFCPAAQKPLGALSHAQKYAAGTAVVKVWNDNVR